MSHETIAAWRPLLEGRLAERAWEAIDAVTSDLEQRAGEPVDARRPERGPRDPTFAGGAGGLAVYYAYLAEVRGEDGAQSRYADLAMEHLELAMDAVRDSPMGPSFFSGFTGVGWVVTHLGDRLFEGDDDEGREIDEVLIQVLERGPWRAEYDLISGLAGFAVYALEGFPRPSARRCLELVTAKFEELAVVDQGRRTWFTPPELLAELHLRKFADGYFNVGLAHGVPAILAVLARIAAAGIEEDRCRTLLDEAVPWVLAQELPAEASSRFPNWVAEGYEPEPSRLAWCYGDLGLATALLLTARALEREDWEREALRVARGAAARTLADAGVVDAGICHGAAGVGHLFNRLYRASGDEELGRAARFWFGHTLELRRPGEGIGGFLSYVPFEGDGPPWREDAGFLIGASGTALALLGAVSEVEPAWDRALLASVPPRADDGD